MAYNPESLKNLEKGTKLTPGNDRVKGGRPAGSRNMRTVLIDWLNVETDGTDPIGNTVQIPLIDKVALAIIKKACEGNVSAANFVSGCAFGKLENIYPEPEKPTPLDWDVYTPEEIEQLLALVNKGVKGKDGDVVTMDSFV